MNKAWQKGISPNEFRKCLVSDLEFIDEFENAVNKRQTIEKRNQEIKQMREGMR